MSDQQPKFKIGDRVIVKTCGLPITIEGIYFRKGEEYRDWVVIYYDDKDHRIYLSSNDVAHPIDYYREKAQQYQALLAEEEKNAKAEPQQPTRNPSLTTDTAVCGAWFGDAGYWEWDAPREGETIATGAADPRGGDYYTAGYDYKTTDPSRFRWVRRTPKSEGGDE